MAVIPYADTTFAFEYFADRLRTEAYDDASNEDKVKALKQATRAIDNLNFTGEKADAAQDNQFPRGGDTEVPEAIKQACCELALAFLDDVDPNLEMENLSNAEQRLGDFSTRRIQGFPQEHIASGIPSIQAWMLLKPFLRSTRNLDIDRG